MGEQGSAVPALSKLQEHKKHNLGLIVLGNKQKITKHHHWCSYERT